MPSDVTCGALAGFARRWQTRRITERQPAVRQAGHIMTARVGSLAEGLWRQPYVLLSLTALFWAGNAVASRAVVGELSPFLLTAMRWMMVLCLVGFIARNDIAAALPVLRKRFWYMLGMGAIGFTAFNSSFYVAAHHTTALNIGIIQGAMPVAVMIGAFLVFGTRITVLQAIGVLVTIGGVIIVAAAGDIGRLAQLAFNNGDLLMLVAVTFYATYAVFLPNKPKVDGFAFFAGIALAALVTSAPLAALEIARGDVVWPTLKGLAILMYVVVFPSFLSQIFFIRGVELIGPGRAGVFVNLVPVFAAGLSVLLLGEDFQLYHLVALALVLGGIWLAERGKAA
jgi:drug/metabolite transporter (DMT)-like permease